MKIKKKIASLFVMVFLSCCSYNAEVFFTEKDTSFPNGIPKGNIDKENNLYLISFKNNKNKIIKINDNSEISIFPSVNNNYIAGKIIFNNKNYAYINYYSESFLSNKDLGLVGKYKILKIISEREFETIDFVYVMSFCGFDKENNLYFYGETSKSKSIGNYSFWRLDEKNNLEEINFHGFEQGGSYSNCFGFDKKTNEIIYYDFHKAPDGVPPSIFHELHKDIYKKYRLNVKTLEKKDFEIDSLSIEFDSESNIYYFKDSKVYKALVKDNYKTKTEIASFVGISKSNANITLDEKRKIIYVYGFGDNNQIFKVKI